MSAILSSIVPVEAYEVLKHRNTSSVVGNLFMMNKFSRRGIDAINNGNTVKNSGSLI